MERIRRQAGIDDGRYLERRLGLDDAVALHSPVPDVDAFDSGVSVADAVAVEQLPAKADRR